MLESDLIQSVEQEEVNRGFDKTTKVCLAIAGILGFIFLAGNLVGIVDGLPFVEAKYCNPQSVCETK